MAASMVTIALGGDTMLGRMVGESLAERPPASVWDPALLEVFAEADVGVVNLECCISERGEPWPALGKPFFFRAPPAAVDCLLAAGIRAVWLANNHALDFGHTALSDTFGYLRAASIAWAGAGEDVNEARRGTVLSVADATIGLIGFADHPEDYAAGQSTSGTAWIDGAELRDAGPPDWLVAEVRRLAASCDVVLVGPHWGPNMLLEPQAHHRDVALALIRAGASLVAGHSAHVVQRAGLIDGAPVCFDLGDLLDDYAIHPALRNDLGLLALFTPGERLELVPLRLEYTRTRLAAGDDHVLLTDRLMRFAELDQLPLRREGQRLALDLARRPTA